MRLSMSKYTRSRISLLFNLSLPIILILLLSLAGATLSSEADSHGAIERYFDNSYSLCEYCIEDVEDKNLKFPGSSFDIYELDNRQSFSNNIITPNNYLQSLNHSRSPPVL